MSNLIDNEDNSKHIVDRAEDLQPVTGTTTSRVIKPIIPSPKPVTETPAAETLIAAVEAQQQQFRADAAAAKPGIISGVATLENLAVKEPLKQDFTNMTEADVYNLDVPMEARPFSNEDSLRVVLLDSGLVARWVNKDPRRLGSMISRGFQYVTQKDLAEKLEVEVSADAEGHFSLGDVVLMKITKERYFPAMRAAHIRAVNSVGPKNALRSAVRNANEYMSKESGGGFQQEAQDNKIAFYTPGVTI